ncbi:MAG: AmmeMemoRadiSam system protein A [archaeon]
MEKYKELLFLARSTLEAHFKDKKVEISINVKEKYSEKGACFVTLTKNGDLRGCIGSLEPRQALYKDVVENSINAGFSDYRFQALDEEELEDIKIEISILTKPKKLEFDGWKDLLDKIDNKMGIVLRCSGDSATFLPQVWEQIPDKEVFLEELSMKAGLDRDAWKDEDCEIEFYRVEKVKES